MNDYNNKNNSNQGNDQKNTQQQHGANSLGQKDAHKDKPAMASQNGNDEKDDSAVGKDDGTNPQPKKYTGENEEVKG